MQGCSEAGCQVAMNRFSQQTVGRKIIIFAINTGPQESKYKDSHVVHISSSNSSKYVSMSHILATDHCPTSSIISFY